MPPNRRRSIPLDAPLPRTLDRALRGHTFTVPNRFRSSSASDDLAISARSQSGLTVVPYSGSPLASGDDQVPGISTTGTGPRLRILPPSSLSSRQVGGSGGHGGGGSPTCLLACALVFDPTDFGSYFLHGPSQGASYWCCASEAPMRLALGLPYVLG
jgi:hypothetical protein